MEGERERGREGGRDIFLTSEDSDSEWLRNRSRLHKLNDA